jgi:hypothetical protein
MGYDISRVPFLVSCLILSYASVRFLTSPMTCSNAMTLVRALSLSLSLFHFIDSNLALRSAFISIWAPQLVDANKGMICGRRVVSVCIGHVFRSNWNGVRGYGPANNGEGVRQIRTGRVRFIDCPAVGANLAASAENTCRLVHCF